MISLLSSAILSSLLVLSGPFVFYSGNSVQVVFASLSVLDKGINDSDTRPSIPKVGPGGIIKDPGSILNPDLDVKPPGSDDTLPYKCEKGPGETIGTCTSTGAADSVQMVKDGVCEGDLDCDEKECTCIWKQ